MSTDIDLLKKRKADEKARQQEEKAAREGRKAQNLAAKIAKKHNNHNKWGVVAADGTVTGLVRPESREQALAEMDAYGIQGRLMPRAEMEATVEFQAITRLMLVNGIKANIYNHMSDSIGVSWSTIRDLDTLNVTMAPAVYEMMEKAAAAVAWVSDPKRTTAELEAYDPATDRKLEL